MKLDFCSLVQPIGPQDPLLSENNCDNKTTYYHKSRLLYNPGSYADQHQGIQMIKNDCERLIPDSN